MTVVDINMHHLPEDLSNEKILDGFLSTRRADFGEIARIETLESGKHQLILEKPKGVPEPQLRRRRLLSRGEARRDGGCRR